MSLFYHQASVFTELTSSSSSRTFQLKLIDHDVPGSSPRSNPHPDVPGLNREHRSLSSCCSLQYRCDLVRRAEWRRTRPDQEEQISRRSPWKGQQRHKPQHELQPVEDEQDGGQDELDPQDEGLQQQHINGERHTRNQDEERQAGGQRALAQVPLPTWDRAEWQRALKVAVI